MKDMEAGRKLRFVWQEYVDILLVQEYERERTTVLENSQSIC